MPTHWSPEQALAVLEALQAVREAVWLIYGRQAQQAWRDQLMPDHGPPDFDPDLPFMNTGCKAKQDDGPSRGHRRFVLASNRPGLAFAENRVLASE